ncbi:hypothetical protein [Candidatus Hodgkinia cicadicola]
MIWFGVLFRVGYKIGWVCRGIGVGLEDLLDVMEEVEVMED